MLCVGQHWPLWRLIPEGGGQSSPGEPPSSPPPTITEFWLEMEKEGVSAQGAWAGCLEQQEPSVLLCTPGSPAEERRSRVIAWGSGCLGALGSHSPALNRTSPPGSEALWPHPHSLWGCTPRAPSF